MIIPNTYLLIDRDNVTSFLKDISDESLVEAFDSHCIDCEDMDDKPNFVLYSEIHTKKREHLSLVNLFELSNSIEKQGFTKENYFIKIDHFALSGLLADVYNLVGDLRNKFLMKELKLYYTDFPEQYIDKIKVLNQLEI
jgi:hypothetical protein